LWLTSGALPFLSTARTNIRGCDRRVTAFAARRRFRSNYDWIAAYYLHKRATRDRSRMSDNRMLFRAHHGAVIAPP
jgi:hypothetical protein